MLAKNWGKLPGWLLGGPQIEVNGCLKAGWEAMAAGDVCSDINLADPTPTLHRYLSIEH